MRDPTSVQCDITIRSISPKVGVMDLEEGRCKPKVLDIFPFRRMNVAKLLCLEWSDGKVS